jgi:drug/metabolite transporter (DMT)-like permease
MIGYFYAVLAAGTWGLVYALEQRVLRDFSPITVAFTCALCGAVALAPFAIGQISSVLISARTNSLSWMLLVAVGLVAAIANVLITTSIRELSAPVAAVLEVSYPIFVGIAGYLLFGFKLSPQFALGAVLIMAGAGVIVVKT